MADLQQAKALVLAANKALDSADPTQCATALSPHVASDYRWRGMHPFNEQLGAEAVAEVFWTPLKKAMGPLQRRPDIFFAGLNELDDWQSVWVVEMGHLMGLWDEPWLGLAPSEKNVLLRFVEFHRVGDKRILETACYIDIVNMLSQIGRFPLRPSTGLDGLSPAPRTHDGLLYTEQEDIQGRTTVELISAMVADLRAMGVESPANHMQQFWTPDMGWYGPGGIGTSASYEGYRRGHSGPFECGLEYVGHTEHVARLGEGMYGGFFGYPSLTMRVKDGFLGLPNSDIPADMRIVDLYRREADKLAENWIFIDLPHFCAMQGIDLLAV